MTFSPDQHGASDNLRRRRVAFCGMLLLLATSIARADDERTATTVTLDFNELINSAVAQMEGIQRPERLSSVSLAAQQTVTLLPQRYEVQPIYDVQTIMGELDDGGSFLISEGNGVCHGAFWTADGAWEITGDGEQDALGQVVLQVSPALIEAGCSGGFVPEAANDPLTPLAPSDSVSIMADPADIVRVLIVYDAEAASDVGNMSTYATAAISSANQAYINSEISPLQLELAGIELVDSPLTSTGGGVLRQLTNRYDNVYDEVHTLRDAYQADLVSFLVDISGFCGVAWLAPGNSLYGFSVSDTDCAVSNLTFAHELGHNMGCNHDPNNASNAYTSYGFGHHWNNDAFRSVMAYSPGTRVPWFSNPDVFYAGGATGIADERDNARTINLTDTLVANMRVGDGSGEDCDNNGVVDAVDIARDPLLDSDGNGELDSCQIASDTAKDCDNNGVIDLAQLQPHIKVELGPASPIHALSPQVLSTGPLPTPIVSPVRIIVGGIGDLGSRDEYVTLNFNDGALSFNAFTSGSDCYAPGRQHIYTATAEQFEPIAVAGANINITTSAEVADSCNYSAVSVTIEYDAYATQLDSDGDGILTTCEQRCLADASADGELDFDDAALLIAQIGLPGPGLPADITNDGSVNMFDAAVMQVFIKIGCP